MGAVNAAPDRFRAITGAGVPFVVARSPIWTRPATEVGTVGGVGQSAHLARVFDAMSRYAVRERARNEACHALATTSESSDTRTSDSSSPASGCSACATRPPAVPRRPGGSVPLQPASVDHPAHTEMVADSTVGRERQGEGGALRRKFALDQLGVSLCGAADEAVDAARERHAGEGVPEDRRCIHAVTPRTAMARSAHASLRYSAARYTARRPSRAQRKAGVHLPREEPSP